jgi:hypothetical protein
MEIVMPLSKDSNVDIERLMESLNSLQDGERVEQLLIAAGQRAIPYLREFLLHTSPRTIAAPRCRAARVLGALGACSTLTAYFSQYQSPQDAAVLFAEDAVRSAVACELMQWRSEATFWTLLKAAEDRATSGLILALGEYSRPESAPLFFRSLEDDLCREDAMNALRKMPDIARDYAVRSIPGMLSNETRGGCAQARCRATLKLLLDLGVSIRDWHDLQAFLFDDDGNIVLSTAQIGFRVAPSHAYPEIMRRLIAVADGFNWLEEQDATVLLLSHGSFAHVSARRMMQELTSAGKQPDWRLPSCRILRHLIDEDLQEPHDQNG